MERNATDAMAGLTFTADVTSRETTLRITENNKKLPPKIINTTDFIDIVSRANNLERTTLESPMLPGKYGTKLYLERGDNVYLFFTTAPREQKIRYTNLSELHSYCGGDHRGDLDEFDYAEGLGVFFLETLADYGVIEPELVDTGTMYDDEAEAEMTVELPSHAWFVHLRKIENNENYRLIRTKVFTKIGSVLSMDDKLYPSLVPNIYGNNSLCWGEVHVPELTVQGADAVDRLFFLTEYNTDLDADNTIAIPFEDIYVRGKIAVLAKAHNIYQSDSPEKSLDYLNNTAIEIGEENGNIRTIGGEWSAFTERTT